MSSDGRLLVNGSYADGSTPETLVNLYVELKHEERGDWYGVQVVAYDHESQKHKVRRLFSNSYGGSAGGFCDWETLSSANFQKKWRLKRGKQPDVGGKRAATHPEQFFEPETATTKKFKKAMDDGVSEFLCPITQELPVDPVMAEDGRVYERGAIEEWLHQDDDDEAKSPHTNEPMGKKLLPALQVKNLIATMIKSGAISGDKCVAWTRKLEQERVVDSLRRQAEAGEASAMCCLSDCYGHGVHGLTRDLLLKKHWAQRAADLEDPRGLALLGMWYLNHCNSAEWTAGLIKLTQAAMLGSELACYQLARHHNEAVHKRSLSLEAQYSRNDTAQAAYWLEKMKGAPIKSGCTDTMRASAAEMVAAAAAAAE